MIALGDNTGISVPDSISDHGIPSCFETNVDAPSKEALWNIDHLWNLNGLNGGVTRCNDFNEGNGDRTGLQRDHLKRPVHSIGLP